MARKKENITVAEKLKALHQLQVIDSQVDKIRVIRGELPLEIEDLEDSIAGLNSRLDKYKSELEIINEGVFSNKNSIVLANEAIKNMSYS